MEQEKPFWQNPWKVFKTTLMAFAGVVLGLAAINIIPGALAAAAEAAKITTVRLLPPAAGVPLPTAA